MKAVVQRVSAATVAVGAQTVGSIGTGLLALVGVEQGDGPSDARYIAAKVREMRVFPDANDPAALMNRSLQDVGGSVLIVSEFTLCGDCRKGRRPSFGRAAPPELARRLYEDVIHELCAMGVHVATGEFQTHMQVMLVNDGPVTLLLDSRRTHDQPL